MISVKFVFNDGKDLLVNIPHDELGDMFERISESKIFWSGGESHGFWTNIENVRFIEFRSYAGESKEEVEIKE